jgi:hypothetical protein
LIAIGGNELSAATINRNMAGKAQSFDFALETIPAALMNNY